MGKCPPGVFCISDGLGIALFTIFIIILVFILCIVFHMKPQTIQTIHEPSSTILAPMASIAPMAGDSRYTMAPQPQRDWMAPPEFPPRGGIASIPINIPTQGLPESFQSIGIINVGDQVLPLYGRRTLSGSDRWNYYTRTDSYNPVPLPIVSKKRNCMDNVGCNEIMSGEHVKIDGLQKEGKTSIYQFDGPKYIPGLL
jgi:hypothetical protein